MNINVIVFLLAASSLGAPLEAPNTNRYWQPGGDLTRVRPAIGPTVFDVTKYGAIGDNNHDDTKAIQTAMDACATSHDGGVVLLPNKKAPAAVGSEDQCGLMSNGNYPGKTLGHGTHLPSADACCAVCGSTSGCECWDWKSADGTCYTKKDCGSLEEEGGRVTGKMNAPPGPPTPAPSPTPTPTPTPAPPAPGPGVPRGAHSEPAIPSEDGSIYLSYPVKFDHATGCALVIEPGVTLLAKPWSAKKAPFDHYKGAFVAIDNSDNCAIGGGGTIRGNGQTWWFNPGEVTWPELIKIEQSQNIALWNFTAMDSAFHHIEMFANNFEVSHLQVLIDWRHPKPPDREYAPCTDGIDVRGHPGYIHNTVIDVGDDNVAIDHSDVLVEDCHFGGPAVCDHCVHGHGATIGSIDSGNQVENVVFSNIVMERTQEGPRIKIRCSAKDGYVKDIHYENMVLHNLQHKNFNIFSNYDCVDEGVADMLPVGWKIIRRETWSSNNTLYRSPDGVIFFSLENALTAAANTAVAAAAITKRLLRTSPPSRESFKSSAFEVSNLVLKNISATGTKEQGGFSCSKEIPCTDVTMSEIHTDTGGMQCHYASGKATDNSPAITCL